MWTDRLTCIHIKLAYLCKLLTIVYANFVSNCDEKRRLCIKLSSSERERIGFRRVVVVKTRKSSVVVVVAGA